MEVNFSTLLNRCSVTYKYFYKTHREAREILSYRFVRRSIKPCLFTKPAPPRGARFKVVVYEGPVKYLKVFMTTVYVAFVIGDANCGGFT